MRGVLGPETECGPLALRRHLSADHLFCILCIAAWLTDGERQEEAKQSTKIGMLKDNGSDWYDPTGAMAALRGLPSLDLVSSL